ncbi:MAG: hypothetical protein WD733_17925 [Bryobacterales bacterium]
MSIPLPKLPTLSAFDLQGLRRITLTVAVLVLLFSGFFWLGYWTGVGHTLIKQGVPMLLAPEAGPPNSAPVHQVEEALEPVWL